MTLFNSFLRRTASVFYLMSCRVVKYVTIQMCSYNLPFKTGFYLVIVKNVSDEKLFVNEINTGPSYLFLAKVGFNVNQALTRLFNYPVRFLFMSYIKIFLGFQPFQILCL